MFKLTDTHGSFVHAVRQNTDQVCKNMRRLVPFFFVMLIPLIPTLPEVSSLVSAGCSVAYELAICEHLSIEIGYNSYNLYIYTSRSMRM